MAVQRLQRVQCSPLSLGLGGTALMGKRWMGHGLDSSDLMVVFSEAESRGNLQGHSE